MRCAGWRRAAMAPASAVANRSPPNRCRRRRPPGGVQPAGRPLRLAANASTPPHVWLNYVPVEGGTAMRTTTNHADASVVLRAVGHRRDTPPAVTDSGGNRAAVAVDLGSGQARLWACGDGIRVAPSAG